MSTTIKLVLPDKTLRRVTVSNDITLDNIVAMSKRIATLDNTTSVHLAYLDEDNDMVTLGTTTELAEYLSSKSTVKKIFISTEPVTTDKAVPQPQEEPEDTRTPVERLAAALAKPDTVKDLQKSFGESPIVVEVVNGVANAFLAGGIPAAMTTGKEQIPLLFAVAEEAIARDVELESAVKDLRQQHADGGHHFGGFPFGLFGGGGFPAGLHAMFHHFHGGEQQAEETGAARPSITVKPIHAFVVCDGCDSDPALKERAKQAGTISTRGWIMGDRFKSENTHDFDLCSSCMETGRFEAFAPTLVVGRHCGGGGGGGNPWGRHHGGGGCHGKQQHCGPHGQQHHHPCHPGHQGMPHERPCQQQQQRGCRGARKNAFTQVLHETLKSVSEAVADSAGEDSEIAQIARAIRESLTTANKAPAVNVVGGKSDAKPAVSVVVPEVSTTTPSAPTNVPTMGGEDVSSNDDWEDTAAAAVDPMVKWSAELQRLNTLGFTDVLTYIPMLEEEHGNLEKVVNRIIRRNA